jgi:DNA invertase Pin-like site-specific DNA recombinase
MKVAIYTRYSSDNQRDASIADQLRLCREFAARQGWTVVQEFTDHAISGATLPVGAETRSRRDRVTVQAMCKLFN